MVTTDATVELEEEETVLVDRVESFALLLLPVEERRIEVVETPVLEAREESWYNSNLFPAPQYSMLLPGHIKLQSPAAARTDPAPRLLPQ